MNPTTNQDRETNIDRVNSARVASGLQFSFTHRFMNWLYFEKYILVEYLSTQGWHHIPIDIVEEFISLHHPHYIGDSRFRLSKYKSDMRYFWSWCCDQSLPFRLTRDEWGGICVVAKTNNWAWMRECLVGHTIALNANAMYFLRQARYNSLSAHPDRILYGPIQFANNQCNSTMGIRTQQDTAYLSSDHEATPEDYENPLVAGQEIRINYHGTEGFPCRCSHCST